MLLSPSSWEKKLERTLRRRLKQHLVLKFTSPGNRGVPDRMVLSSNGICRYVELKDKGKKPDPLQDWWHKRLRAMGFEVDVIDNFEDLEIYINRIN